MNLQGIDYFSSIVSYVISRIGTSADNALVSDAPCAVRVVLRKASIVRQAQNMGPPSA